ncbi:MAG: hypothetical protein FWD73_06225 [Polyangiaceae bacterium]|nr:hypothetical protein [Polyangiaceae bacterium]
MGQPKIEELDDLLATGKLGLLAFELRGLEDGRDARSESVVGHVRRLRAELARRDAGALVDLVFYAHERIATGAEDAAVLAHATAHRLRRAGARRSAERLLGRIPTTHAQASESTVDELVQSDERTNEASVLLGAHDFAGAAARFDEAAALLGSSELALEPRLAAALARWAGGAGAEAREQLGKLVDDATRSGTFAARRVHAVARDLMTALDREVGTVERGPSWAFAVPSPPLPVDAMGSLAELRRALTPSGPDSDASPASSRRPMEGARIVVDEKQLSGLLARGCTVLLEEERPTTDGIVRVLGFDAVGRVLLVQDIKTAKVQLASADEQWRRCEMFGRGALVLPTTSVDDKELADDPRLVAIDACRCGDDGAVPPVGFIVRTMSDAVEGAESLPVAHKLLGEALLQQVRDGHAPCSVVYTWYARTRERLLDAEWPLQFYAETLGYEGRHEESALAWSEAAARDPFDDRNVLGEARLVSYLGWDGLAERLFRRTVALRPDLPVGYTRLASLALASNKYESARICAEIATELESTDANAWMVLASVHEAEGETDEALAALRTASQVDTKAVWPHVRMARHMAITGQWQASRAAAEAALALDKSHAAAWHALGTASWATGDIQGAYGVFTEALRHTKDITIASTAVRAAAYGWTAEERYRRIAEVVSLCRGDGGPEYDIAFTLHVLGYDNDAVRLLESVVAEQGMGNITTSWWLLQGLARVTHPSEVEIARQRELAAHLFERAPGFPPLILLRAYDLLASDPQGALAFIQPLDPALAPAALWEITARALERTERTEDAAAVRARITDVLPNGALYASSVLVQVGCRELARDLLLRAEAAERSDHFDIAFGLARLLADLGDANSATEHYIAAERAKPGSFNLEPAIFAAITAKRWADVERLSETWIDAISRDSLPFGSVWGAKGARAGALLARGDESGRDELLAVAGAHPDALLMLVRIEKILGSVHLAPDRERLLRIAPGVRITNEENAS